MAIGSGGGMIDFGAAITTALAFADGSGQAGAMNATLTITSYTVGSGDSLRFGSINTALTHDQLAAIAFSGFGAGAAIDALGNIFPAAIPEPAAIAAALGAAALLAAFPPPSRSNNFTP